MNFPSSDPDTPVIFNRYDISQSTRHRPTYIIQACGVSERNEQIKLLLGLHLETTALAPGRKYPNKSNAVRLHIKSDAIDGLKLGNMLLENPYNAFGHVGGDRRFVETVHSCSEKFTFDVRITESGKMKITRFQNTQPTLLIDRRRLLFETICPELREGEADPYFGGIKLVSFKFGELVDKVRSALKANEYILID